MVWMLDVISLLLLCAGAKLATPRLLRLLCRIGVLYLIVFSVGYYFWLTPQFQYFKSHPHLSHPGMSMAFGFEGFWHLLGNMVLLQGIFPLALMFLVYFGIKWLPATSGPGASFK